MSSSTIRLVRRSEIDIPAYDRCIQTSTAHRAYAESWYLDIVSRQSWSVLMSGNYEAVIPIPWSRNLKTLWKKEVIQPPYCQQLGLIAKPDCSQQDKDLLWHAFDQLKPSYYQFNSQNTGLFAEKKANWIRRSNYTLCLDRSYSAIEAKYSSTLKKNLIKPRKSDLHLHLNKLAVKDFISFKIKNSAHHLARRSLNIASNIIHNAIENNRGQMYHITYKGVLCSAAFFLISEMRIIYLIAATDELGRQLGASHYVLDEVIRSYSEQPKIFDFEGSDNDGLALFFKRFGATKTEYLAYRR